MPHLGLGLLLVALLFGVNSSELMMGTIQDPGPGWFPFWLSMIMVALSLNLILMPQVTNMLCWQWINLIKTMLAVLVMAAGDTVGLLVCSFVSMMIMRDHTQSLSLSSVASATLGTAAICVLVTEVLSLPLPLWPR